MYPVGPMEAGNAREKHDSVDTFSFWAVYFDSSGRPDAREGGPGAPLVWVVGKRRVEQPQRPAPCSDRFLPICSMTRQVPQQLEAGTRCFASRD